MIESGMIGSLIFYGPPSSGKTTLAHVISKEIDARFEIINAVLDGIKDLRRVVSKANHEQKATGKRTILFVDEIHRWNKAQQDALLPHLGIWNHIIWLGPRQKIRSTLLLIRCCRDANYLNSKPLTKPDIITMIDRSLE